MQDHYSTILSLDASFYIMYTLTTVSFLRIPSHIDLLAHDAVDLAAKELMLSRKILDPPQFTILKTIIAP